MEDQNIEAAEQPAEEAPQESSQSDAGASESRKYRQRAQAAEQERDTLREQVATFQRKEAVRVAGEHLMDGEDLFVHGTELADVLGEDGQVDANAIETRSKELTFGKNYLAKRKFGHVDLGPRTPMGKREPSFADIIKGE